MSKKLVLIDGHSILNRAFYGLPDLTNSMGQHTNAVYGFLNILFRILEEEKPDYLAVAFDVHAKTFRHELYEAYKGTRKPMPEEYREQVPMLKEVLSAMQITILEQPGLEADDILGTLAKKAEKAGMEVALISGDRDLLQIASDRIKIRIPKTKMGKTEIEDYYAKDVLAAWQVTPEQFIELKALMGDTADNIPALFSVIVVILQKSSCCICYDDTLLSSVLLICDSRYKSLFLKPEQDLFHILMGTSHDFGQFIDGRRLLTQINADDRKELFPGDLLKKCVCCGLIAVIECTEQSKKKGLWRHITEFNIVQFHLFIVIHFVPPI